MTLMLMMNQTFLRVFSEIIREQVSQKNEIEVKGLGVFGYQHRKQYQRQYNDGRVVMMPPKDLITFIPEKSRYDHR